MLALLHHPVHWPFIIILGWFSFWGNWRDRSPCGISLSIKAKKTKCRIQGPFWDDWLSGLPKPIWMAWNKLLLSSIQTCCRQYSCDDVMNSFIHGVLCSYIYLHFEKTTSKMYMVELWSPANEQVPINVHPQIHEFWEHHYKLGQVTENDHSYGAVSGHEFQGQKRSGFFWSPRENNGPVLLI